MEYRFILNTLQVWTGAGVQGRVSMSSELAHVCPHARMEGRGWVVGRGGPSAARVDCVVGSPGCATPVRPPPRRRER